MALATASRSRVLVDGTPGDVLALIPSEAEFEDFDAEFLAAPALKAVAHQLMAHHARLSMHQECDLDVLWRQKGGQSQGSPVWAKTTKLSGLAKHYSGQQFVIWVAADHAREQRLSAWQLEALLFHELNHIAWDEEDRKFVYAGHDWEGFAAEIAEYGAWHSHLFRIQRQFEQMRLPDPEPVGAAPAAIER